MSSMHQPPSLCYPFDGHCHCSRDANLCLTFDGDEQPLRVNSCLLVMTSPVVKRLLEDCSIDNDTLHFGMDNRHAWLLLLNMVHPIASQTIDRHLLLSSSEERVHTHISGYYLTVNDSGVVSQAELGALAKKYDAESILIQLDDVLCQTILSQLSFFHVSDRLRTMKPRLKWNRAVERTLPFQREAPLPYHPYIQQYSNPGVMGAHQPPHLSPLGIPLPPPPAPLVGHPPIPAPPPDVFTYMNPYNTSVFPINQSTIPFFKPVSRYVDGPKTSPFWSVLPLLGQAVRLNLTKSLEVGLEALTKELKIQRGRLRSHLEPVSTLGQSVSDLLKELKADGFEIEAFDIATRLISIF